MRAIVYTHILPARLKKYISILKHLGEARYAKRERLHRCSFRFALLPKKDFESCGVMLCVRTVAVQDLVLAVVSVLRLEWSGITCIDSSQGWY